MCKYVCVSVCVRVCERVRACVNVCVCVCERKREWGGGGQGNASADDLTDGCTRENMKFKKRDQHV